MALAYVLNNIVVAFVKLLIGFILGKVLGTLMLRVMHEADIDKLLKRTGARISLEKDISRIVEYGIYFVTILFALDQLKLAGIVFSVILWMAAFLLAASLLLKILDFIPNFFSGLLLYKKNLREGASARINNVEGKIIKKTLLETRIKTRNGDIIRFPNSILLKSRIFLKRTLNNKSF